MANEIAMYYAHSKTVYFLIFNRVGQVWRTDTNVFEAYSTANYANYTIAGVEAGTASSLYLGTFPSAITAGVYSNVGKQQLAGSAAETDPTVGIEDGFQWSGTVEMPLSDLATSGQLSLGLGEPLTRGVMMSNFKFFLVSSLDHITALTSGIVSGQISRDNGTFGPLQSGAFTEDGLGCYRTNLTSGDLLCNTAALVFTGVSISGGSSDPRRFSFVLNHSSGN